MFSDLIKIKLWTNTWISKIPFELRYWIDNKLQIIELQNSKWVTIVLFVGLSLAPL